MTWNIIMFIVPKLERILFCVSFQSIGFIHLASSFTIVSNSIFGLCQFQRILFYSNSMRRCMLIKYYEQRQKSNSFVLYTRNISNSMSIFFLLLIFLSFCFGDRLETVKNVLWKDRESVMNFFSQISLERCRFHKNYDFTSLYGCFPI